MRRQIVLAPFSRVRCFVAFLVRAMSSGPAAASYERISGSPPADAVARLRAFLSLPFTRRFAGRLCLFRDGLLVGIEELDNDGQTVLRLGELHGMDEAELARVPTLDSEALGPAACSGLACWRFPQQPTVASAAAFWNQHKEHVRELTSQQRYDVNKPLFALMQQICGEPLLHCSVLAGMGALFALGDPHLCSVAFLSLGGLVPDAAPWCLQDLAFSATLNSERQKEYMCQMFLGCIETAASSLSASAASATASASSSNQLPPTSTDLFTPD